MQSVAPVFFIFGRLSIIDETDCRKGEVTSKKISYEIFSKVVTIFKKVVTKISESVSCFQKAVVLSSDK